LLAIDLHEQKGAGGDMPKLSYRMSRRRLIKSGIYLLASLTSLNMIEATHPGQQRALAQESAQTLAYGVGAYGQGVYGQGVYASDQEIHSH
jgi:hypothetical protein